MLPVNGRKLFSLLTNLLSLIMIVVFTRTVYCGYLNANWQILSNSMVHSVFCVAAVGFSNT